MNVILDPNLYKMPVSNLNDTEASLEHIRYFDYILDFINENNIGRYFLTNLLESELFSEDMENPWNKIPQYQKGIKIALFKKVFHNMIFPSHDVTNEHTAAFVTNFNYPNGNSSCDSFLKTMNYIVRNHIDTLLFYGTNNHAVLRPSVINCNIGGSYIDSELDPVFNPMFDFHERIRDIVVVNTELANQNEIFPLNKYSRPLGVSFYDKIKKGEGLPDTSVMRQYGEEIALRNGYKLDSKLSSKNSIRFKSLRTVFTRPDSKYYLSIDYEKGAFEVFDSTPIHLGEYKFSGDLNQQADPANHVLIL